MSGHAGARATPHGHPRRGAGGDRLRHADDGRRAVDRAGTAIVHDESQQLRVPPTQVGRVSPPQQLTVTNRGSSTVQFRVSVVPAPYPVRITGCNEPVPPNQSCTAEIVFAPQSPNHVLRDGRIRVASPDGTLLLPLTLPWLPLVLDPAPPVSLGRVQDGTTCGPSTLSLRNFWTAATTTSSVTLPPGSRFAVASSTCGGPIASGATCTVAVTYSPVRHVGADSDTLTITGPWGENGAQASEVFEFTAEGTAASIMSVSPASLHFPTPSKSVRRALRNPSS